MPLPSRPLRAPRLALLLPLVAGCAALSLGRREPAPADGMTARRPAVFPADWRFRPGTSAEFARNAMIASNSRHASEAGVEILRRGGNAVDAAVAVGYALAVTYPVAGNIGGGGFMVIRLADGRSATIDYREVAPLAATRNMFLDAAGQPTDRSRVGHLAVGVPGAVMGMSEALAKFGTKSLAEVLAPAIRLAEEGFVIDSAFTRGLRGDSANITRFAGASLFFPGGQPLRPGSRLVQADLARTLRRIADKGAREFYEGETADLLVAEMQRGGGLITKQDLAQYRAIWRDPLRTTYRGHTVIGMPPVSSGGTTSFAILHMLETRDTLPSFGSVAYAHLLAEAERRAFIDRNTKLCDPAFCTVPMAELTSKAYARQLAGTIDPARASRTPPMQQAPTGLHTTHYSVVDRLGNAVSTTTTLNLGYGSGVYVAGAGFFLNDEMDDLATAPGKPNAFGLIEGEQNRVEPGKRPLSSMTPSIVLDPQGQVLLVAGAAGGPTIISGTTQVILNVIDHRMTLADAMRAPRIHHQALPDSIVYERNGMSPASLDSLRAMGHGLQMRGSLVNVNAVMRVRGGWEGVSEPRSVGAAVGY
ncbi:gamma-glutamyltransferase [Roseisolibacter sp. H3M3-2]|uniref:gamma-glutamyltransferase n=1 Tax=Roseisolibacter sp. H3M3-2 TaxID=3031323 RepID=UPI0023DBD860|nr:gamma-glutamyltransferase [Roseisolibacter sp. H3M3-2]MDF1505279.1 gamma-glutamyltransferase [Roseisolibacter sp. H3M3-2]